MKLSYFIQFLPTLFIGAVVTANILGNMAKQLNKTFVFFRWKGINCVRSYVIPSNPRTTGQVLQRNLFSAVMAQAQFVKIAICQKFWKKFAVKMSAFNAFVSANCKNQHYPLHVDEYVMSKGSMTPTVMTTCTYTDTTGKVDLTWSPTLSGNQGNTDNLVAVVVEANVGIVAVKDSLVPRSAGTVTFNTRTGFAVTDVYLYTFFYRSLGTVNEMISNDTNIIASEP